MFLQHQTLNGIQFRNEVYLFLNLQYLHKISDEDFNLYENFFHNNIAEIGGALRYVEIVPLYF
jgi:hypothetical protein